MLNFRGKLIEMKRVVFLFVLSLFALCAACAVSYTHLDVYKRQDVGVIWQSMPRADYIDMNSVNANRLSYETVSTPPGTLMFKIGLLVSAGTRNCCVVSKCGVEGHHKGNCKARHE